MMQTIASFVPVSVSAATHCYNTPVQSAWTAPTVLYYSETEIRPDYSVKFSDRNQATSPFLPRSQAPCNAQYFTPRYQINSAPVGIDELNLPPMWTDTVKFWFTTVENIFQSHRVTSDAEKFCLIVSVLNQAQAQKVSHVILGAVGGCLSYDDLKQALIKAFGVNPVAKVNESLPDVTLESKRPSVSVDSLVPQGQDPRSSTGRRKVVKPVVFVA
uniref:Uncharacterized protein LOC100176143 n=1 Tax=Phallusia mammillata TaxID=59560 RepID=A0A6F9DFP5_9ASCI|nr:uncharacterized protein LOC100176143 [Phallusia mammillata]